MEMHLSHRRRKLASSVGEGGSDHHCIADGMADSRDKKIVMEGGFSLWHSFKVAPVIVALFQSDSSHCGAFLKWHLEILFRIIIRGRGVEEGEVALKDSEKRFSESFCLT